MGLIFFRLTIVTLVGLTLLAAWAAEQTREIPGETVVGVELLNLADVTSLEQRFVATEQWLVGFDLGLRADAAAAALPLQLRVRSADGLPIDLVSERMPMGATDAGQLRVRFAPLNTHILPHTITSTLLLQIDPPPLPPTVDARIVVRQSRFNQETTLINGVAEPGLSLSFTPIYQQTLLDSFWPVSTMAAQRAGWAGWPPLYPLLIGGFLISLCVALRRLAMAR